MKIVLFSLLFAVLLAGCSRNGCVVEGTVTGLPDGKVYLNSYDGKLTVVDSTVMEKGKFTFKIDSVYPRMLLMQFAGQKGMFPFILEDGRIEVVCDFDSVPRVEFGGTPSNDLLAQLNKEKHTLIAQQDQLESAFGELSPTDTVAKEKIVKEYEALSEQIARVEETFIKAHNDTFAAAYLLSNADSYGFTSQQMDSVINILASNLPANAFTDALKKRRNTLEQVAVGKPAPDFTMTSVNGTPFTLSSLKGKCVLIDFWASWCGPCRKENPKVVGIYNKYKDKGFTVVGVSLDDNKDRWTEAIASDGLTWTHVSDLKGWESETARNYGVVAIPHTVLVDTTGTIVANVLFGDALEAQIVKALGLDIPEETVDTK